MYQEYQVQKETINVTDDKNKKLIFENQQNVIQYLTNENSIEMLQEKTKEIRNLYRKFEIRQRKHVKKMLPVLIALMAILLSIFAKFIMPSTAMFAVMGYGVVCSVVFLPILFRTFQGKNAFKMYECGELEKLITNYINQLENDNYELLKTMAQKQIKQESVSLQNGVIGVNQEIQTQIETDLTVLQVAFSEEPKVLRLRKGR